MNGTIKVSGGVPLRGEVTPIPNKNSILAALPACILTNKTVIYKNVPQTTDVSLIVDMLRLLGAKAEFTSESTLEVNCSKVNSYRVDETLGNKIRASMLFAGPLLARFGIAELPVPGGCTLGRRSISAHIDVFQKAGVTIEYLDSYVRFTAPKSHKNEIVIWQSEASVTGTENFAMYASGVPTKFTLIDAASEPHVSEVLNLLIDFGAEVSGIGSNKLTIKGRKDLSGAEFTPGPDFVDIAGYITAAALTDGEIKIKGANVSDAVDGLIQWFMKFNINISRSEQDLTAKRGGELFIDTKNSGFPMAGNNLPKLYPRPWPGLSVDVLPVFVTLACKTSGRLLLSNWMYETGLDFSRELNTLGADIFIADPQKIIITGPVNFVGGEVLSPGVIQACKAIFLASLCDPVETTLHGVNVLKRRYPNIFEIYSKLGANIEIIG